MQRKMFREDKHNMEVGQGVVESGDFQALGRREMTRLNQEPVPQGSGYLLLLMA